ncbi:hypothetical protein J7T55_009939 [Diaporthe amygdali]|uniref:uncharacterized protein n=1 Tax=Phomopsis amygdali TaxID=1214568 RepID=UPI0022FECE0C|nr:uncharacterized protein J7T55_009939 [Diaporthe amygdali]KAJ0116788.1 hypothetical protein J7T55_009939 [Diaporthe amygdali]
MVHDIRVTKKYTLLLFLVTSGFIAPTVFDKETDLPVISTAGVSRGVSVLLMVTYGAYLFFQLSTHKELFGCDPPVKQYPTREIHAHALRAEAHNGGSAPQRQRSEAVELSIWTASVMFVITTALVYFCVDFVVNSVLELRERHNSPSFGFSGYILIPVLNCDVAAVEQAERSMNAVLTFTFDKSLQMALFCSPFLVLVAWGAGFDEASLSFDILAVTTLFTSVYLMNAISASGNFNLHLPRPNGPVQNTEQAIQTHVKRNHECEDYHCPISNKAFKNRPDNVEPHVARKHPEFLTSLYPRGAESPDLDESTMAHDDDAPVTKKIRHDEDPYLDLTTSSEDSGYGTMVPVLGFNDEECFSVFQESYLIVPKLPDKAPVKEESRDKYLPHCIPIEDVRGKSNTAPNQDRGKGKDLATRKRTLADQSGSSKDTTDKSGSSSSQATSSKRRRTSDRKLTFACPYTKKDPMSYRDCYKYVLSRIRDVKQHLARCHRNPPYCPRCMGTFETEEERDGHVRESSCPLRPPVKLDGITESQKRQLAKKSASNTSVEDQWFAVFDILFPGHDPRPRSPYIDSELLQDITLYQDFLTSSGPQILSDVLTRRGAITWNLPNEERDLAAFQQTVFEEGLRAIFDQWVSRRSNSSQEPSGPSGSESVDQDTPPSSSTSLERVVSNSNDASGVAPPNMRFSLSGRGPTDTLAGSEQEASSDQIVFDEGLDGILDFEHEGVDFQPALNYDGPDEELMRMMFGTHESSSFQPGPD